ncbi:MAG: hypothetical protein ACPLN0_04605 [Candidatus Hydrothermia bacterium]
MHFKKIIFFLVSTLLLFFSCKREKSPVVARVGKYKITASQIDVQIPEGFQGDPRVKDEIKRQYINEVLFYNAAKDEGMLKDEELRAQIKVTEIKVTAQYYLNRKLNSLNVSDGELKSEFEKSRQYFNQKYDMIVLYFSDKSKAADYRRILMNPYPVIQNEISKFSPQEVQVAPISENLGVIYYTYGNELFNIIKSLKIGEISDPVPLSSQYYVIIKVVNISNDKVTDDDVKEFLRRALLTYKQSALRDSLITALQAKYKVMEVR